MKSLKHTSSLIIFFLTFSFFANGQIELPSMPERVSNNAVTEGFVNGIPHVFSFSGIDSTKIYSGIHKRAFRYNTETQVWDQIADLPSGKALLHKTKKERSSFVTVSYTHLTLPTNREV